MFLVINVNTNVFYNFFSLHTAILPSSHFCSRKHLTVFSNLELMAGVEPATSSLPRMRSTTELHQQHELAFGTTRTYERINKNRAENGAQTRDPQLGRLVLYRLSYFRELTTTSATVICGSRWIRTTEGENQQIYSLPHLAALEYSQYLFQCPFLSLLSDSNQRPRDYKSRALAN